MMTDETMTPMDEQVVPTPESVATAPDSTPMEAMDASIEPTMPAPDMAPDLDADAAIEPEPVTETASIEVPFADPTPAEPAAEVAEPTPNPAPVETMPVASEPVVEAPIASNEDDMALFEAAFEALQSGDEGNVEGAFKRLSRGDRVEATVIQVEKDKVFVDLGTKSEGIIPLSELTDANIEHPSEIVQVGDKIQVVVTRPENSEGGALVSKRKADFEDLWDTIEDSFKDQKTLNAQVVDRVKGGLVVDIGVRGFVPATHVGNGKIRNIEKYVGQALPLKIIEIDRERKKVVLSNRQADEERRAAAKEELFNSVKPGEVMEGTVRRLADYGAFVDLGGVDGLLHISEMSWMRIQHPREMFKEGQKIKVMVLKLDPSIGKISLGHRQVLPDPWNLIRENYTLNQKFTTKVSRLVVSGAFVKLPEGAEAFIPLSEMSARRIRKPEEAVEENQEVEVQIIDLRPDERRMVLSIRAVTGGYESRPSGGYGGSDDDRRGGAGTSAGAKKKGGPRKGGGRGREDDFDDSGRRGFATGGATIGERLGMLKGLKGLVRPDDDEEEEEATPEAAPAETEETETE